MNLCGTAALRSARHQPRTDAAPVAQSSCAEAASFDLPAEVLGACIAELQRALEMALVKAHDSHSAAVFAEGMTVPWRSLRICDACKKPCVTTTCMAVLYRGSLTCVERRCGFALKT